LAESSPIRLLPVAGHQVKLYERCHFDLSNTSSPQQENGSDIFFTFLTMTANYHKPPVPVFIFMGTSGCGKSSVAAACQKILGCELLEGDELHPKANIDKMSKGKSRCWIAMGKGAGRSFVEEGEGFYARKLYCIED